MMFCFGRDKMKKTFAIVIALALACLALSSAIKPANASVSSIEWIGATWKDYTDSYLGYVSVGYLAGATWKLNVWVSNDAWNGTQSMDARVYRVAVWFDWNKLYNTTFDVTMKYGTSRLFTVEGTMESTSVASNLYKHKYKIYVEYEITYQKTGSTVIEKKTWPYPVDYGTDFAVIAQDQYDAKGAKDKYTNYYSSIASYVDDFTQSWSLLVQAQQEANIASGYYNQGDFSSALSHYNNAWSYLNQSFTAYTATAMEYDEIDLNETKAELDKLLAEIEAIRANATATLAEGEAVKTLANGQSQSFIINAVGFVFFGIGFIIIGVATVIYAKKPKPA